MKRLHTSLGLVSAQSESFISFPAKVDREGIKANLKERYFDRCNSKFLKEAREQEDCNRVLKDFTW